MAGHDHAPIWKLPQVPCGEEIRGHQGFTESRCDRDQDSPLLASGDGIHQLCQFLVMRSDHEHLRFGFDLKHRCHALRECEQGFTRVSRALPVCYLRQEFYGFRLFLRRQFMDVIQYGSDLIRREVQRCCIAMPHEESDHIPPAGEPSVCHAVVVPAALSAQF